MKRYFVKLKNNQFFYVNAINIVRFDRNYLMFLNKPYYNGQQSVEAIILDDEIINYEEIEEC